MSSNSLLVRVQCPRGWSGAIYNEWWIFHNAKLQCHVIDARHNISLSRTIKSFPKYRSSMTFRVFLSADGYTHVPFPTFFLMPRRFHYCLNQLPNFNIIHQINSLCCSPHRPPAASETPQHFQIDSAIIPWSISFRLSGLRRILKLWFGGNKIFQELWILEIGRLNKESMMVLSRGEGSIKEPG